MLGWCSATFTCTFCVKVNPLNLSDLNEQLKTTEEEERERGDFYFADEPSETAAAAAAAGCVLMVSQDLLMRLYHGLSPKATVG